MRQKLKSSFLEKAKLGEYQLIPLPMDASFRSYDRVRSEGQTFILMDSPPDKESTKSFIEVAQLLLKHNFKAPQIIHIDEENGFLLLEDFGHVRIKDELIAKSAQEEAIYLSIINLLSGLQQNVNAEALPSQSEALLLAGIETYLDWYCVLKEQELSSADRANYLSKWQNLLSTLPDLGRVIVLRDFHVENLMSLPDGEIGVLDFQDAAHGHPAYDLVSLLQDARYQVSLKLEQKMLDAYLVLNPGLNREQFITSYNILGAQRNLRILGVFARKALRDNQNKYLELLPRVEGYLARNLEYLKIDLRAV